jgi:hypothetical protein
MMNLDSSLVRDSNMSIALTNLTFTGDDLSEGLDQETKYHGLPRVYALNEKLYRE